MLGGWMHKSNFGGHSKSSTGNVGAYVSMGMRMQMAQYPSYVDTFANNTLVFGKGGTYIEVVSCTQHLCPQAPRSELCPSGKCFQHVSGNRIFGDKASVNTPNGTIPVAEWLAMGFDPDSAVVSAAAPTDAELIAMAAATLAESGHVKG